LALLEKRVRLLAIQVIFKPENRKGSKMASQSTASSGREIGDLPDDALS
jgi:hypothetical protein